MAQMPQVFVPSEKEDSGFSVVPEAWYIAEIVKSEIKATKDKQGTIMVLAMKILEGKRKGRLIYTNYNIVNRNETTVKIAEGQIKQLCETLGIDQMEDTDELHKQEFGVFLVIEKGNANWPDKNKATKFKAASEVVIDEAEEESDDEEDDDPFSGFDNDAKEDTVDVGEINTEAGTEAEPDDDIPF